eukprot:1160026-Pelagomonas_calceolata.AAC.4
MMTEVKAGRRNIETFRRDMDHFRRQLRDIRKIQPKHKSMHFAREHCACVISEQGGSPCPSLALGHGTAHLLCIALPAGVMFNVPPHPGVRNLFFAYLSTLLLSAWWELLFLNLHSNDLLMLPAEGSVFGPASGGRTA